MTSHKYIKKLLIIHILLAILVLSGCGDDLTDVEYVQRAKDFQDNGDLVSAVIELKNAASKNPENPEARLILGQIYLNAGNGPAAEKELVLALKLGVSDLNTKLDLFESYLLQRKFEKIINGLQLVQFTSNKAMRSRAYLIKGNAFLGEQDTKQAKSLLKKSVKVDDNPSARVGLIKLLLLDAHVKEANQAINEALVLYPSDFDLLLVAADYHRYVKEVDRAINFYSKALAIKKHINALLRRADLYVVKNNIELAEKDVASVQKMDAKHPMAHFIKGKIEYRQKDYEAAQQQLEQVVRVLPNQMSAVALLGVVNYHLGFDEQAIKYLEKYNSRMPGNTGIQKLLGEVYVRLGRGEDAIDMLTNLTSQVADDPGLYLLIGSAYAQNRDFKRAKESLEIANNLAPSQIAISNQLAILRIQSGEDEKVSRDLEAVLEGTQANKQAEILLIWALVRSNELDKALKYANLSVEKEPEDPARLFARGLVLQRKSNLSEAKEDFIAALEKEPDFFMADIALAEIALKEKDFKASKKHFKQALSIRPTHLGSLMGLAVIENRLGNSEGYIDQLLSTIELRPDAPQPVNALVNLYLRRGSVDKADNIASQFQRENPNSLSGYDIRAKVYNANKDYVGAEDQLRRYLKDNPDDTLKRMSLIETLRQQQNLSAAIDESEQLIIRNDYFVFVGIKVRLLIESNQLPEANKILNNWDITESKDAETLYYNLLGDLKTREGDFVSAVSQYQQAYDLSKNVDVLKKLIKLDIFAKKINQATMRVEEHLEKEPQDLNSRILLASLYSQNGQFTEAENEYKQVLKAEPNNVSALNNLALLYAKQGKPEAALDAAYKVYQLLPSAEIMDTYGWMLANAGQFDKALPLLEKAYSGLNGNEEVAYHLASVLLKVNQHERAKVVIGTISNEAYLKRLK